MLSFTRQIDQTDPFFDESGTVSGRSGCESLATIDQKGGCLPRLLHWLYENIRLYVYYYLHGKSLATSLKCKRRALNDMHFLATSLKRKRRALNDMHFRTPSP